MLSHYQMKEIPYLRILGRTNGSLEPVTLFWTASGIELNVKATEIWVKIRSDYDVFEPWVDVIVDGVLSQRLMVNKGAASRRPTSSGRRWGTPPARWRRSTRSRP